MNPTDTNQASEDELDTILKQHREWMRGIRTDRLLGTSHAKTKEALQVIIRTEKLKLLDEVIHQSTVNLKSAKAVAGWAELRKEQLEANQ